MTATQFTALMERFDKFEERFGNRLRRVEIQVAAIGGGLTLAAILLQTGVVNI